MAMKMKDDKVATLLLSGVDIASLSVISSFLSNVFYVAYLLIQFHCFYRRKNFKRSKLLLF